MYHPIEHADDSYLASTRRAYHRRIWPHGARAIARREVNRAARRHGRDLCRAALDLEAWADHDDFEEMLRAQDEDEDEYEPSWMDRADARDREHSNMMADLALETLRDDADWLDAHEPDDL